MPLQAVALKKYRCGTSPVSKTSDNEHTTAPLWNSGVLSVKNPVGEPIPEFCQTPEEGTKSPCSIRQDTGDVLPNQPAGAILVSNGKIGKGEVATRVSQSLSESRDAEWLAGRSADENIDSCIRPVLEPRHIAVVRRGVVVTQKRTRERLNLGEECRAPSKRAPGNGSRFNTGADRAIDHPLPFCSLTGS
jgi:hypothetical protein